MLGGDVDNKVSTWPPDCRRVKTALPRTLTFNVQLVGKSVGIILIVIHEALVNMGTGAMACVPRRAKGENGELSLDS